jgi:hypothetical protein
MLMQNLMREGEVRFKVHVLSSGLPSANSK